MNNKGIKRIIVLSILLLGVVLARHVYWEVLPYRSSQQKHFPMADESGEYDKYEEVGEYLGQMVISEPLSDVVGSEVVLGSQDDGVKKHIEVDLSKQMLYAVEDGERVAEFVVSTGKWGRTPTGTFRIWSKFRSTKMEGGRKELRTYYYLPNVPYTMFFANDEISRGRGYGIHGAYWHSNFGEVMSHGCVNMRVRDVEKLYFWAGPDDGGNNMVRASGENVGTEVVIYREALEG